MFKDSGHDRKVKSQTGKGVISAGSYGCVNKPAIQCQGDNSRVPYSISKRMTFSDAIIEYKIGKRIEAIDPYHYFTLKSPRMCIPGNITEEDKDVSKMKHIASKKIIKGCSKPVTLKDRLLIMEDAGIDIYRFGKEINKTATQQIYELYKTSPQFRITPESQIHTSLFIYKEIYRIILGLIILNENHFVHNDVRYQNMLIHPQTGQLRLIDYSLTVSYKQFTEYLKDHCVHEKSIYPPESCLAITFGDSRIPYLGSEGGLRPNIRKILMDILNTIGLGTKPETFLRLVNELKAQGETTLVGFLKIQGNLLERDIRNRELILMLLDLNNIRTQEDFQKRLFLTTDTYMAASVLRGYIHNITKYHPELENTPLIHGIKDILTEMKNPRVSIRLNGKQALKKIEELRHRIGGTDMDIEFRRIHKIPSNFLRYIIN
jgi:hypothetical protein